MANTNRRVPVMIIIVLLLFSCTSNSQNIIKIDFNTLTGIGSPLMYGGNNYGFSSNTICVQHKQAGFNVARYDALINEIVPVYEIENYKRNLNNVQNPET